MSGEHNSGINSPSKNDGNTDTLPADFSSLRHFYAPPVSPDETKNLEDIRRLENITGFLFADLKKIADFAAANNVVLGFRPISKAAIAHLRNGAAGKGMDIKGKSADQGPIEGLIPYNQAFSKCGTSNDAENVSKYNDINEKKLQKDEERYQILP